MNMSMPTLEVMFLQIANSPYECSGDMQKFFAEMLLGLTNYEMSVEEATDIVGEVQNIHDDEYDVFCTHLMSEVNEEQERRDTYILNEKIRADKVSSL